MYFLALNFLNLQNKCQIDAILLLVRFLTVLYRIKNYLLGHLGENSIANLKEATAHNETLV